ncbi:MAG TPA: hypothetical protein VFY05_10105 [Candidatus Angelobacter sp.]|nr:hypothetical protein [Candidatus Angelobacter sp.]
MNLQAVSLPRIFQKLGNRAAAKVPRRQSARTSQAGQQKAFHQHLPQNARAPSAIRTLISRCPRAPRVSIRLATLAHASSSTSPTSVISTVIGLANVFSCSNLLLEADSGGQGLTRVQIV